MTTPDQPVARAGRPSEPESKDRVYRSPAGMAGGVLLLALAGWLGGDALVAGEGRTPWLALAALISSCRWSSPSRCGPPCSPNDDRLRVRNPFRVIVLPWGQVAALRSGYSNEVVAESGTKYQLWAVPVSLRARKKAARQQARAQRRRGGGGGARAGGGPAMPGGRHRAPMRAQGDQIMDELRELREAAARRRRPRRAR